MGKINGSIPNQEEVLLRAFEEYLKTKVSPKVTYEYLRVTKQFLKRVYGLQMDINEPRFTKAIKDFLDIENSYTYRNTLAAMKQFFTYLGINQYLQDYKFKASMPNFSIATPSFEDVLKFHNSLENDRIKFYFELGTVSAIRPEHLLRLTKKLFDKPNKMINTWMKTFGKKNFFFSFYTENSARASPIDIHRIQKAIFRNSLFLLIRESSLSLLILEPLVRLLLLCRFKISVSSLAGNLSEFPSICL